VQRQRSGALDLSRARFFQLDEYLGVDAARSFRAHLLASFFEPAGLDPERLRATSAPQGGTHAAPRWHVRRGHWRQLADGRRVFVRQCEVGDPARGGVVKDYIVKGQSA